MFITLDTLKNTVETHPSGVCAHVSIRLVQDAVLTRSAFNGIFSLRNEGSEEILEEVTVTITIEDTNGNDVTDRFAIQLTELTGLPDLEGGGFLPAGESARAQWLIVPTHEAAPVEPVPFRVGGTMTYILNGNLEITDLFPDRITVYPDPVLSVDYFHERIIYSDDPFTPETEPTVPYSLGLIVSNSGAGTARNLSMTSGQPEIIENEKGLRIFFTIIGAQLGLNPIDPSLTVNLGDIEPGGARVARWILTSSLQGEFTGYNADFRHVDAIGDAHISLFESVAIHEMTHVIRVDLPYDDQMPDFLVNDILDPDSYPDTIYTSGNYTLPVNLATGISIDGPPVEGDLEVQLTATVPTGWAFFRLDDPAGNGSEFVLERILRSDGREILLDENAWTTHRILRPEGEPEIPEHHLHLIDSDSTGSYTLFYRYRCLHTGDVSGDSHITAYDAQLAFYIVLEMITPTYEENCAADCNGNGSVTAGDVQAIFFSLFSMDSCVDSL